MSERLLRQYIAEVVMDQSLVKKDGNTGKPIIRKLVTFRNPGSRYGTEDNVDTDFTGDGNIIVDDSEVWEPDFEDHSKPRPKSARSHKRLA